MAEPIAAGSAILAPHPLVRIHVGSALAVLRTLPECYFHEIVTSPPFYGVRDYEVEGAIGMEKTLDEYLNRLVEVFSAARRVLRDDGVLWVEMGDAFVSASTHVTPRSTRMPVGNLVGLPWEVAKALRESGWILRSEVIVESNRLPEAARDRVSRSHSTLFMFSKARKYFYDRYALLSPVSANTHSRGKGAHPKMAAAGTGRRDNESFKAATAGHVDEVFARSVWRIGVDPYKGKHSSTFPVEIPRRCMRLGTSGHGCCALCGAPFARHTEHVDADGVIKYETMGWVPMCGCAPRPEDVVPCRVLDLFGGSGSTALAGIELQREVTCIEINPESADEAVERIQKTLVPGKPKRARKQLDPPPIAQSPSRNAPSTLSVRCRQVNRLSKISPALRAVLDAMLTGDESIKYGYFPHKPPPIPPAPPVLQPPTRSGRARRGTQGSETRTTEGGGAMMAASGCRDFFRAVVSASPTDHDGAIVWFHLDCGHRALASVAGAATTHRYCVMCWAKQVCKDLEHPRIAAARSALAEQERKAEQDLESRTERLRGLTPHTKEFWEACVAYARAQRAWKAAVNRRGNTLAKMIRIHGAKK